LRFRATLHRQGRSPPEYGSDLRPGSGNQVGKVDNREAFRRQRSPRLQEKL
jgi:hypothetical protein